MAMGSESEQSPKNSPNKRLKTLTPTLDYPPHQSPPLFVSKGKSKIEENEYEPTDCCGICLSESGADGVSRGYIDSCSHYFCFVCIMEWAKVESKCPLCKRRFSTIRRPPKPPIFPSERVVPVPVRDQDAQFKAADSIRVFQAQQEGRSELELRLWEAVF